MAAGLEGRKSWMAGTRPAMTIVGFMTGTANDSAGIVDVETRVTRDKELLPC
jgi:hypothetical protein